MVFGGISSKKVAHGRKDDSEILRGVEKSTVETRAAVAALCDVDCGEKGMAPLVWLTVLSGSLCNSYTLPDS